MIGKFLDPKNDLAFKRVFGTERNKDILVRFLNDIFDRHDNPVEEVTFLQTNQDPKIAAQRTSIVDILCKDARGEHFIVEMQVAHDSGFEKRAQYYAAKAYIEQRDRGVEYKDLKQVTFLAITDFSVFPKKKAFLSHHHVTDTETGERDLKDFYFSFLQLPQFNKEKDELRTPIEKWAYFFKYAEDTHEDDLKRIIGKDTIIKKAYDELNRYNWSKEDLRTYDSVDMKISADRTAVADAKVQGLEEGEKIGIEKGEKIGIEKGEKIGIEKGQKIGIEKGEKKKALEIARNLLSQNVSLETVTQVTGLSREEIAHEARISIEG